MEMHQIRYFLAVSRTLNFTKAAAECHVSQPSLTKAIQKLEEEMGGLLLRRERGLTHLTDLGRLVLPHLEQTYAAAQAARSLAEVLRSADVAPLKLGIGDTVFLRDLPEIFQELHRTLKGLQLSVSHGRQDALIEEALKGGLDVLVLAQEEEPNERLRIRPLFQDRFVVLCPGGHRLGNLPAVDMAALNGEAWIEREGCPMAPRLLRQCRATDVSLDVRHRALSEYALQQMVAAGMGCAFSAETSPRIQGIQAVPLCQDALAGRSVVLATVSGRAHSQACDAFLRLARLRDWTPALDSVA